MTTAPVGPLSGPVVCHTLLGNHPGTLGLRSGLVTSPAVSLSFADVPVPNKAFKRVVRDLEFDVAELALMTFVMARSRGVPLRLLPVVLFSRNPLPLLVCRADRAFGPRDLMGRRIGVRSYTTTTAVWTRAVLADRFGVDLDRVDWVTYEEGHVAGVTDPPNVSRDSASANLVAMLLDGAIDAAIVDPVPDDPRIVSVVPDPPAAHRDWCDASGADTVNHVVVVREALANDGVLMRELFGMFRASAAMAPSQGAAGVPIGFAANRRTLEVALAVAEAQRLLAQPLSVDDLVSDVLRSLD